MQNTKSDSELCTLLDEDEFDFRYDCGVTQPLTSIGLKDKDHIVTLFAKYLSVARCLPQLEQLREGLELCDILQLVMDYTPELLPLFVYSDSKPLTSEYLFELFYPNLSPIGSNKRDIEETSLYHWANYLQQIESKYYCIHFCNILSMTP